MLAISKTSSYYGAEMEDDKKVVVLPNQCQRTPMAVRTPEDPKYIPWMQQELPNYKAAVQYMAFFFENRAGMGDMETTDLWAEFKQNVCLVMRDGVPPQLLE